MAKKPIYEELKQRVKELEQDVRELKRAEGNLRESEQKLLTHLQHTPIGAITWDLNFKVVEWNPAAEAIFGYTKDETLGKHVADLILPEDMKELVDGIFRDLISEKGGVRSTNENITKDGRRIICDWYNTTLKDADGRVVGVASLVQNITERKQAEEALRKERAFSESLIDTAQVIILVLDTEGRIVRFNPYMEDLCGYKLDEVQGRDWFSTFLPEQDYLRIREIFRTAVSDIRTQGSINPIVAKDGREIIVEWFDKTLKDAAGNTIGLLAIGQDITSRKQSEDELRESEERYKALFDRSLDCVYIHDFEGNFIDANPAALDLLGYSREEITSLNFSSLLGRDQISLALEVLEELRKKGFQEGVSEYKLKNRGGEDVYTETKSSVIYREGKPYAVQGIGRDIAERKQKEESRLKLEAQLQQSQKMEAVGTLAGGIAHDFNNILAIIIGNAELASVDVPDSNPASYSLKEIQKASIRAKNMIQQLLAFSRKTDGESKPLDMAPIIKESMKMLRSAIPTSVEFKQHISDDPCSVMGDAAQINQIVMNLVTNAADAMSEEGGHLEVTLEKIIFQEEKPCFHWILPPGAYVRLRMRDTGEGIEPKIMDQIFDPYYTTKEVGKGTGMGLSVIHGIVKRHGGGIRVESESGKGTLFEIYFPALEKRAEEEKEPEGEIKGGSERILFVDDEESMVDMNRQLLERLGYDVKSTTKPVEALERFKADPDQFDVIITDMTMPRMTGDRLASEVLKIRPHMPVIICTGYSERMSAKKAEALGARKYIEKPIGLRKMASALREVLGGNNP